MTRTPAVLVCPAVLAEHPVVVVDVEGNGTQPPEIVEIALLMLTAERPVTPADLLTWLVRPTVPISGLVTAKVHGISNADVADAPAWTEIEHEVAAAIEGRRILVAHHAAVERRVLGAHLPGWQPVLVLDTLRLARAVWPDLPGGYGLDRLITYADLTPPAPVASEAIGMRRHRAGYDVWMTTALLITLINDSGLDWAQLYAAAALPDPHAQHGGNASVKPQRPTGSSGPIRAHSADGGDEQEGLW